MKHAFLKLCIALKYVQYIGFNVNGRYLPSLQTIAIRINFACLLDYQN